jgi:NADPH2:quinone reductase
MTLPYTPGTEGAGVVVAVGDGVTDVRVGDRVASEGFRGSYAELAIAPAARLVPLPAGVTTTTAAAAILQGITAHYLTRSTYPLNVGEWCLVHAAAGGVGLLLCQLARRLGAHAIGTASTTAKQALAREAGAVSVVSYEAFTGEVRRLTEGRGVSVVYDSVGRTTFDLSLECLTRRGMMVLFGQSSGPVPPMDPQILNRRGSLYLTRPTIAHHVVTRDELMARCMELFGWIASGTLVIRIGATFPLADAAEAHRSLESRQTTGKVTLRS